MCWFSYVLSRKRWTPDRRRMDRCHEKEVHIKCSVCVRCMLCIRRYVRNNEMCAVGAAALVSNCVCSRVRSHVRRLMKSTYAYGCAHHVCCHTHNVVHKRVAYIIFIPTSHANRPLYIYCGCCFVAAWRIFAMIIIYVPYLLLFIFFNLEWANSRARATHTHMWECSESRMPCFFIFNI